MQTNAALSLSEDIGLHSLAQRIARQAVDFEKMLKEEPYPFPVWLVTYEGFHGRTLTFRAASGGKLAVPNSTGQ